MYIVLIQYDLKEHVLNLACNHIALVEKLQKEERKSSRITKQVLNMWLGSMTFLTSLGCRVSLSGFNVVLNPVKSLKSEKNNCQNYLLHMII